jgi:hypothetical protein
MADSYRALKGLRYPDGPTEVRKRKRGEPCRWVNHEPGDEHISNVPPESVKWLLEDEAIEPEKEKGGKQ